MSAPADNGLRTKRGHRHGEAFCLMVYTCRGKPEDRAPSVHRHHAGHQVKPLGCGHRETFWNSRDGVTPFGTSCPSCGGTLLHDDWRSDRYAPEHVPHRGQGIWRDGTPDEAERFMRERLERCKGTPYEVTPEKVEELVALVRSEHSPDNTEFQKGWPMFYRHGGAA